MAHCHWQPAISQPINGVMANIFAYIRRNTPTAALHPSGNAPSTGNSAVPVNYIQSVLVPPAKKTQAAVDQKLYDKILSNYNADNLIKNIALETEASNKTIKSIISNYRNLWTVVIKTRATPKGESTEKHNALSIMRVILKRQIFTSVAQIACQISINDIYDTKRGAQYWMCGIVLGVTLMPNKFALEPILRKSDPTILSLTVY